MPEYLCFCGGTVSLPRKQHKLIIPEVEKFCSVGCFYWYLQNLKEYENDKIPYTKSQYVGDFSTVEDQQTGESFRSWYEVHVARFLRDKEIVYEYESRFFTLGNSHYTPDFYLPKYLVFIEVKGLWGMSAKTKFRKALKAGYDVILLPAYLAAEFRQLYSSNKDGVRGK